VHLPGDRPHLARRGILEIEHLDCLAPNDIDEKKDLAAEKPEVVRELAAAWKAWNSQNVAPLWQPRGTPVIPINGEKITWDI
jgi:hypothetical protein